MKMSSPFGKIALVEVMIIIAIIGLLASIFIPDLPQFKAKRFEEQKRRIIEQRELDELSHPHK